MTSVTRAFIGLGANLGDPVQQILDARKRLYSLPNSVAGRCSSLYLSTPVGYAEQPNFINCVLELDTRDSAQVLFSQMQEIETNLGRLRDLNNQNAPRMIDIDLILFGSQVIEDRCLVVPHPRMGERLFVLEPLLELGVDCALYTKKNLSFEGQQLSRLSL